MLLCITADYTAEALKAMASNPSNRQEALSNLSHPLILDRATKESEAT
jgi:hypothetical protein